MRSILKICGVGRGEGGWGKVKGLKERDERESGEGAIRFNALLKMNLC